MINLKIKIKKLTKTLSRIPGILAKNAFLTFLAAFSLILIASSVLFYKYDISAKKKDFKIINESVEFKTESYDYVLQAWQEREEEFKEAGFKNYSNPFK